MDKTIKTLLDSGNEAIVAFTKRDLLGEGVDIKKLWILPIVQKILSKQQPNGSWLYPNRKASLRSPTNYDQYETYKTIAELVEFYGLTKVHPAIKRAADYLFTFQRKSGEFRGMYGAQYSPNYSASITEFLIKAGYKDFRIKKSLNWLLSMRQEDGGWAIPLRTVVAGKTLGALHEKKTIEPDRSKPFSHLVTGIVLRPFSLLPEFRARVREAGLLLGLRVFKPDKYVDRKGPEYWTKFTYPYHWTDLLSTIDTLTLLGLTSNPAVKAIKDWFTKHQTKDGLYNTSVMAGAKYKDIKHWISLHYQRVLKRL